MIFEPLSDLVFVYMPGCEACEAAMPELDKFASSNPNTMIVRVRADGPMVDRLVGKRVKATPTYVYRRGREGFTHEGMMTAKAIHQWIDAIIKREEGDEE